MNKLADANQRWHALLDSSYQALLESLTALEFELALAQWGEFAHSLTSHIKFEQDNIEPLAQDWESNTLKLIRSDHLILQRLLPRLDAALSRIQQADAPRAELVRSLDGFIKMRNVLEHHDLREMENLYPLLDEQLDKAKLRVLVESMDTARKQRPDVIKQK